MRAARVLVLGAINQDAVARVERHPLPGETVVTDSIEILEGGKGANLAIAAAADGGVEVQMIGAVGDDAAGVSAVRSLALAGVNVSLVHSVVDVPTGRAYVTVGPDGQNSIVVGLGANAFVSPSSLPGTTSADVVVGQTEIGAPANQALARLAVAAGARFVLNDGPAIVLDAHTMAAADPLIVNEFEAATLLGRAPHPHEAPAAELAARLRGRFGSRSVIVTLGARGSVIADDAGTRAHPAVPAARVIDTTGAGDVFVGTFAACVARGADNDAAVASAAAASAASVAWRGARPPTTSRVGGSSRTVSEHLA